MVALILSLKKNKRLLEDLVLRDLKARYVGSSMGFFWSVIFPIINLFVYMFVFRLVLNTRWNDHQGKAEVALLMLAGIMVWQAFAESVSRMTNTLVENQNLIQKVVFPSEVLPVYLTISALINMLIGLFVAVLGVLFFAYVRPEAKPVRLVASSATAETREPEAGNGLVLPAFFRCASNSSDTRYQELVIGDASTTPWNQGAAGLPAGSINPVVPGDIVYAATGAWGIVRLKVGANLTIDRWRAPDGRSTATPVNGTQAFVVVPPDRPLGLSFAIVELPILIALQGLLMLGLGYFLSAFNLFLRDTYHVIGVLMTVWMFATPIFYPALQVEKAGFGLILRLNPMYWLIDAYRDVLIYGTTPDLASLARFALVAVAVLILGAAFFMAQKPRFPDLL